MHLQGCGAAGASATPGVEATLHHTDNGAESAPAEERLTAHQWAARPAAAGAKAVPRETPAVMQVQVELGHQPVDRGAEDGISPHWADSGEGSANRDGEVGLRVQASTEDTAQHRRESTIQRLLRERDALLATGMYDQHDALISELDRRAAELSHSRRDALGSV